MSDNEVQLLSAEWRAIVLSELKEIKETQKSIREDLTAQMLSSATKEDFKSLDERLTKIENINSKYLGGAIILNIFFIGLVQYIINIFKMK
jgi:hypothetical protein